MAGKKKPDKGESKQALPPRSDEPLTDKKTRAAKLLSLLKKSTGTEVVHAIRAAFRGDSYIDPALANLIISPYIGATYCSH